MTSCPSFVPNLWKPLLCSNCLSPHSSASAPTSPTLLSTRMHPPGKPPLGLASPSRPPLLSLSSSQKQPHTQTTREHRRSNSLPIPSAAHSSPSSNGHLPPSSSSHHHALPHSETAKRKKDASGACDSFLPQRWRPSVCMHCFEPISVHPSDFGKEESYMTQINMEISAPLPEDDGNGLDDFIATHSVQVPTPTTPRAAHPLHPHSHSHSHPHPHPHPHTLSRNIVDEVGKLQALSFASPPPTKSNIFPLAQSTPSPTSSRPHPLSKSTPANNNTPPRTPPSALTKSASRGSIPHTVQFSTPPRNNTTPPVTPLLVMLPNGTPRNSQPPTPRGSQPPTPRSANGLTTSRSFSSDDDPFRGFEELQDDSYDITSYPSSSSPLSPSAHHQGFDISARLEAMREGNAQPRSEQAALRPMRSARGREQFFSQYRDDDEDWDGGVDMDVEKNLEAMAEYTYVNNKIMEIASVKREAERSQASMRDNPRVVHALYEILAAKQKQIQKALDREKINEQDHMKLLERLNAVKDLLRTDEDVETW